MFEALLTPESIAVIGDFAFARQGGPRDPGQPGCRWLRRPDCARQSRGRRSAWNPVLSELESTLRENRAEHHRRTRGGSPGGGAGVPGCGCQSGRGDHRRLPVNRRRGRHPGERDCRRLLCGRRPTAGPQLSRPHQQPPQDECFVRQAHAADRGHLRDLSIRRLVHGHPRLGRLPSSGTCQTHQHGQQSGLERGSFPPGPCG